MRKVATLIALIAFSAAALADQDRILTWNDIRIASTLPDNAGTITVSAKHDGTTWKSLEIEAFGKKQSLSNQQLQSLRAFTPDSLKLTYGTDPNNPADKAAFITVSTITTPIDNNATPHERFTSITIIINPKKEIALTDPTVSTLTRSNTPIFPLAPAAPAPK